MLGWLGTLFLIGVCVIVFLAFTFTTDDPKRAIAATSFIAFGLAIFLKAMSLINTTTLIITLVLMGLSLAVLWKRD